MGGVLPADYSLTLVIGATFEQPFTWRTGPTRAELEPVDLTGWTAEASFHVRNAEPVTIDSGDGIDLGGDAGTITLTMTDEQTAELRHGEGRWALALTSPSGRRDVLVAGDLAVVKV